MTFKTRIANRIVKFLNHNTQEEYNRSIEQDIIDSLIQIIQTDTAIFYLVSDYFQTENQSIDSFLLTYNRKIKERDSLINQFKK